MKKLFAFLAAALIALPAAQAQTVVAPGGAIYDSTTGSFLGFVNRTNGREERFFGGTGNAQLLAPDGAAGAPSYGFANNPTESGMRNAGGVLVVQSGSGKTVQLRDSAGNSFMSFDSSGALNFAGIGLTRLGSGTLTLNANAGVTISNIASGGVGTLTLATSGGSAPDINVTPFTGGKLAVNGNSVPYAICKSAVAVSAPADTTEDTLATCTIPANALGANGMIRLSILSSFTNNANAKTLRIRYSGGAGAVLVSLGFTTQASVLMNSTIQNRGATNSQTGFTYSLNGAAGLNAGLNSATAVDTTASSSVVITCQKAVAGDACTLESILAEIIPN